jgi:2,3-bisphosphoglycerate-independent phosphoglycerate mutase
VEAIRNETYGFIRLNYANGDMVGHTGVIPAVRIALETVDLCLARIVKAIRQARGILVVTADHGNSDDMYERHKKTGAVVIDPDSGEPKTKTAHSLNPVPVHIYDPGQIHPMRLNPQPDLGISSLAATCLTLLGFEPPEDYTPSIVNLD